MKFNKQEFNKELKSLAIPLALQSLLTALVSASDALMLGRLNQESIAAVSLASQIAFVMTLFSGALTGVDSIFLVPDQLRKKREHPPGCKVFPGFHQNL